MRRLPFLLVVAATPAFASPGDEPILGGTQTHVGDFPTVVEIEVGDGLCTGTIISPDWVLTAAHCVTPAVVGLSTQTQVTTSIRVHVGTVNFRANPGTVIQAADSIPDPGFHCPSLSDCPLGRFDSGLIRLKTQSSVPPVPLNFDASKAPVGTAVTQVGFGETTPGNPNTTGVEFKVNQTAVSCSLIQGASDANLLCYNQSSGTGKCEGDSGGPSFAMVDGKLTQVGITSFGDMNCAQFGADTRTDAEKPFITAHVPIANCTKDSDCPDSGVCFQQSCIAQPFGPKGVGSTCSTGADCESMTCANGPGGMKCTLDCTPGAADACPSGFDCLGLGSGSGASGACWPGDDGGGCCSGSRGAPTAVFGIALVGLVLRRRRR